MPPRHRKGIADAVNPPEPDDSSKQIAEKDLLHRAASQASARRHLGGLVTSGQLCPDLPAGYVITGLLYRPRAGSAVSEIFQWFPAFRWRGWPQRSSTLLPAVRQPT